MVFINISIEINLTDAMRTTQYIKEEMEQIREKFGENNVWFQISGKNAIKKEMK